MRKGTDRLDTSRPYSQIYGPGPHRYEQGGRYFGGDMIEVFYDDDDAGDGVPADPNLPENMSAKKVSRTSLAARFLEVAGQAAPKSWTKKKLQSEIRKAVAF